MPRDRVVRLAVVGTEHLLELGQVAGLRRGRQRGQQALVLAAVHRQAALAGEPAARAGDELPGVGLGELEDVRDLPVGVVERLAEDVGGALGRRQLLEQRADGRRERFVALDSGRRVGGGVGRLGQPAARGGLVANACGVDDVDRESRRGGPEERPGVADGAPVGAVPANPGVLHHVLGFSRAADDPVGDAEQARAHGFELRQVGGGDGRELRHGAPSRCRGAEPAGRGGAAGDRGGGGRARPARRGSRRPGRRP